MDTRTVRFSIGLALTLLLASAFPAAAGTVTRDQAITQITNTYIVGTPAENNTVAYMTQTTHGFGEVITDALGNVLYTSGPAEELWVAFLNDDIAANWSHGARLFLIDANDVTDIQQIPVSWWIVLGGVERYRDSIDPATFADMFWGDHVPLPLAEDPWAGRTDKIDRPVRRYAPTAAKICALIVKGSTENRRSADATTYESILAGEGVAAGDITTLDAPTDAQLRAALHNLPNDCDKLYVMWTGHGSPNSVHLENGNTSFPAQDLADSLKAQTPKEVCLVFDTCYSGSLLDEMCDAGLVGTGIAAAEADKCSYYHRKKVGAAWVDDFDYFPKFLKECIDEGKHTDAEKIACIKSKFQNLTDAQIQEGAVQDWFAAIRAQCPTSGSWGKPNDTVAGAFNDAANFTITCGQTKTGTTAGAQNDDPCGDVGNDVYFIFHKQTGQLDKVTITVDGDDRTTFEISLYKGNQTTGAIGEKVAHQPNWGVKDPIDLTLECLPDGYYYICVDEFGYKDRIAGFTISVQCEPWTAPASGTAEPANSVVPAGTPASIQGSGYTPEASYPVLVWPTELGGPIAPGEFFPPRLPGSALWVSANELGELVASDLVDHIAEEIPDGGTSFTQAIVLLDHVPDYDGQWFFFAIDRNGNGVLDFEEVPSMGQFQMTLTGTSADSSVPARLETQPYPNPFNPVTNIRYELPFATRVSLRIFDVSGRLVRQLLSGGERPAGMHTIAWDGQDDAGHTVASGMYVYQLQAGSLTATRSMTLLK